MDYTKVQTLVDRINTMTGDITYSAFNSTGTEVVFNNLTSAGNITMTQPGGYSFPKLSNAAAIDLRDDYETTVTNISFPALLTFTSLFTDTTSATSGSKFEVEFTYATTVDFGATATIPGTQVEVTTKKDATLDLGAWVSKDASGNYITQNVTLNGPASFTNGTAAGVFASTGLPGQTLGTHDGTIALTNVATAAVHNFRGTVTLNGGVKNFTGNNIVTVGGAMGDIETINLTLVRDNDPALTSADLANQEDSDDNDDQNLSFGSSHTKLTSITITGKGGDVTVDDADAVTTVNLSGLDAYDIDITNNDALTSYTDASKAEDFEFDNNDLVTSLDASHTTKITATSDKGVKASITGNAELTSLTIGFDDVNDLDITSNAKLATLSASALKDNGSDTVAPVDIYDNAFVAASVKDAMESDAQKAATGYAVGATSDLGTITSDSGLSTLDAYLADALASTSTISVWFDSVTKLEIQSAYGGTYTDTTASLPTAAFTRNDAAAADFTSSYTGYLVYLYNVDAVTAVNRTDGAISYERKSYAYDIVRNATTLAETTTLGSTEGIEIFRDDVLLGSFKDGDAYSGAANGSTVQTLDDLIKFINADTALDTGYNIDLAAAQDAFPKAVYTITYTSSSGANASAGAVSGDGLLNFTFGTRNNGSARDLRANVTDNDTSSGMATGIIAAINADGEYTAAATGGNGNAFYVTKHVSGSGLDRGPLLASSSFPTLTIVPGSASTTTSLVNNGRGGVSLGSGVAYNYDTGTTTEINNSGSANGEFSVSTAKSFLQGLRLTMTNKGNAVWSNATGATVGAASNTTIVAVSNQNSSIAQGLIAAGTNIQSYAARSASAAGNEATADYVAAFSAISSGTSTPVTAGVTAVLTNRTGW
jgi:hypothetical protein